MTFQKYIDLLQEFENSSRQDLKFKNSWKYRELLDLEENVLAHVLFTQREDYFRLFERFSTNETMLWEEFVEDFYGLYDQDKARFKTLRKNFDQLASIELNDLSLDVYNVIDTVFGIFECVGDVSCSDDPKIFKNEDQINAMVRDLAKRLSEKLKPQME